MKTFYVYELVNSNNQVEYVGETTMPEKRLNLHKCNSNGSGKGKFYGRNDITMRILKKFNSKPEAFEYQCQLQSQYGLETDKDKLRKNSKKGSISGRNITKKSILCYSKCKTKFIKEYEAIMDASRDLKISNGNIGNVLSGKSKQTHGFYFEYKNKF